MPTIADNAIATLRANGVTRAYGIPGDSLNGFTEAMRRDGSIDWHLVRHEEAAAFAAAADAELTGDLAVVLGSCGPGNLHLINGLFDAHRNRVPVLAIAAQIPSAEIGSGYFQETHPQELFRECSVYAELVSVIEGMTVQCYDENGKITRDWTYWDAIQAIKFRADRALIQQTMQSREVRAVDSLQLLPVVLQSADGMGDGRAPSAASTLTIPRTSSSGRRRAR